MKNVILCIIFLFAGHGTYLFAQKTISESVQKQINEYSLQAQKNHQQGNKSLEAQFLNKLAYINWENEKYLDAISYFKQSAELNKQIGNNNAVKVIFGYIGTLFTDLEQYEKAIEYFEKSLEIAKKAQEKSEIANIYFNIAVAKSSLSKFDESNAILLKTLEIAQTQNNIRLLRKAYGQLAENYKKIGNNQKSLEYYNFFLSFDRMIKEQEMKDIALKSQIEISKAEGEKKAKQLELDLQSLKLRATSDSLDNSQRLNSERQMQINLLNNEQKIKDLQITQQNERHQFDLFLRYSLIIFLVFILTFIAVLFMQIKQKRKANKLLAEMNKEVLDQNAQIEIQSIQLEFQNVELEKLSIVASKTDNAVVIIDKDGEMEWANDAFARIYGYNLEEFKTHFGSNIFRVSKNPNIYEVVDLCKQTKLSQTYTSTSKNKYGHDTWAQTTLTPIFDANNDLTKLIAVDSDITKIKQAEKNIHDSINYASRIQGALLPPLELIQNLLPQSFILFRPRDIVSGDFYWTKIVNGRVYIAAADCTGHGVPGAFMSALGISFLDQIVKSGEIVEPADILNELRRMIISSLRQSADSDRTKDGMDIALCMIDVNRRKLHYSGAYNHLNYIRNNELKQIKADKMPIGLYIEQRDFTNHELDFEPEDYFYIHSDGFADQFGGGKREKFKAVRLHKALIEMHTLPMMEQKIFLEQTFDNWRGGTFQMDDVLIIGFNLSHLF